MSVRLGLTLLPPQGHPPLPLTLDVQLGGVLGEALQADLLSDEGEELLKGRPGLLVVVHLLLRALAGLAVEDAHFVFPAELQRREWRQGGRPGRDGGGHGTKQALSDAEPGELPGSHRNSVPQTKKKKRRGGTSQWSLCHPAIPERHNKVLVPPFSCFLHERGGRLATPFSQGKDLGRLPTVGGLDLAKVLQKEILEDSV